MNNKEFGSASAVHHDEFFKLYKQRASAVVTKDLPQLQAMHVNGFTSTGTDGKTRPESDWARDVAAENLVTDYSSTVHSIIKLSIEEDSAIAHVVRKCTGVNNKGRDFNTEISLVDKWKNSDDGWRLEHSETVNRRVWLNGNEVTMTQLRPTAMHMMQGCGDVET